MDPPAVGQDQIYERIGIGVAHQEQLIRVRGADAEGARAAVVLPIGLRQHDRQRSDSARMGHADSPPETRRLAVTGAVTNDGVKLSQVGESPP